MGESGRKLNLLRGGGVFVMSYVGCLRGLSVVLSFWLGRRVRAVVASGYMVLFVCVLGGWLAGCLLMCCE